MTVRSQNPPATGNSNRGFRADVQGLRAVAVALVLLYHAGVPPFSGGYVGVDVFFVISGFLISSHLLQALERDGRVNLPQFYARRARRILPASFVVIVVTVIAAVMVVPPLSLPGVLQDALATTLYVPNIWFALQDTDYLADHAASPLQHYWSLGVEEQFYLLWPLLLWGLVRLTRGRPTPTAYGIGALAAVSFLACVIVTWQHQPIAFFLLPTRAWELLVGALVGAAVLKFRPRCPELLAAVGGWAGAAAILAAGLLFDDQTVFPGTAVALPVLGTALVIWCGTYSARGGPTVLALRPLQRVGLISYSLYLVHWPLLIVPKMALGGGPLPMWAFVLLGIVIAVPAAWILHRFVEQPLRSPALLTRRPPRLTLIGVGTTTVVLVVALAALLGWAQVRPIDGGHVAVAAPEAPVAPPPTTQQVPAGLTPSLREVDDDVPDLYGRGCHHDTTETAVQNCVFGASDGEFRVALFGDSHSAQWLPALQQLADEHAGMAIRTYTKSSCPAVAATVLVKNVPCATCDTWRDKVTASLVADPPDLVVISSYSAYDLAGGATGSARTREWSVGLATTVERLSKAGSDVLVIADTPRFESAPPTCVSAHLTDVMKCAGDPQVVLDPKLAAAEKRATKRAGGRYLDLMRYVCSTTACPAVMFDLLVYRDVNHLTTAFVRYLAPALDDSIMASH
ncbi:MAG: acyltransferase family protein [Microlunatus sp.]